MKNRRVSSNNFIIQGTILALAGVIARAIGLLKRIPLTNIIGDTGNAFYSAANEVYIIMLLISSYSIPLAVSKLVAARVSRGEYRNARRIFRGALMFATCSGGAACIFVFITSDFLASRFMLEPMSAIALKTLAPTILIVAIIGVFRGFFQGVGNMKPTAFSQILEQIVLAIVGWICAYLLFGYGEKVGALRQNDNYAFAYGAAGGSIGTGVGAFCALICLIFIYMNYHAREQRKNLKGDRGGRREAYGEIFRVLIITILPVILSTVVYNAANVLDQRIYNQVMIEKGLSDIKSATFGVYSGKYRVIINIPVAIANAMCASIVPTLTAALSQGDERGAKRKTSAVIRFTMLISIPSAVGITVLAKPIVSMLFGGEIDQAAAMLHVGTITVVLYALSTLTSGVLQGMGNMRLPVLHSFTALAAHLAVLWIMLKFMNLGIYALVYSNIVFSLMVCVLNSISIRKHLHFRQEVRRTFIIPTISSAIMGVVIFVLYKLLSLAMTGKGGNIAATLISVLVGGIVYFITMILLGGIRRRDIKGLPGGSRIAEIFRMR